MKSVFPSMSFARAAAVLLLSFAGGILNGLVGSGSGIVFLFLWPLISAESGTKARYAFAMTCVLIVSIVSLFLYPSEASADLSFSVLASAVLCGIFGGTGGAILKDRIKTSLLNRVFALLTLYSGLSMVLHR